MKGLSFGTIGSLLLASYIGVGHTQEISTVRELSPEEAKGRVAIVIKIVGDRIEGICNYGKMLLKDKPMAVIAKHCVLNINEHDITTKTLDYLVTPNITNLFQNRGLDVKFIAPYAPPIRERSDEDEKTIIGKQVTINSCIPGSGNSMQCWEIQGTAHVSPAVSGQNSLKISNEDYKNILISGDRRGGAVTGMSGNIILDSRGRVFGVLSMASAYNPRNPYQIISFEALRQTRLGGKTSYIPE
ncbi:hypothetical protein H7170_00040 [Candidatus Gracilibacteria bacterium]|nr:hypothetical protein [Candidatus Gracilibacteria bacterium]